MGFQLVPKLVTLNDLEQRNGHFQVIRAKLLYHVLLVFLLTSIWCVNLHRVLYKYQEQTKICIVESIFTDTIVLVMHRQPTGLMFTLYLECNCKTAVCFFQRGKEGDLVSLKEKTQNGQQQQRKLYQFLNKVRCVNYCVKYSGIRLLIGCTYMKLIDVAALDILYE